jgi:uncharacterized membrane protein YedE/YeeE
MKFIKFLLLGVFFGIILAKAEVISWYRIYEMFKFQSFHMYGIIGSAVVLGAIGLYIMKVKNVKTIDNKELDLRPKQMQIARYLIGGSLFGMGWALSGACPGPLFILLGYGFITVGVVIIGALVGTFLYGILQKHLPH